KGRGPAGVDLHVAADGPVRKRQPLMERREAGLIFRIVRGCGQENTDAPHTLALLPARRERPRRRAAEKRNELAPFELIQLHPLPIESPRNSIADCQASSQRLAALRDFGSAYRRFGSTARITATQ